VRASCRHRVSYTVYSEVGVARKIERALVIDDEGNVVVLEKETTGVTVENDEGVAVAVQTAVRGVVLGNVHDQQETTPMLGQPSRDDDGCCWCFFRWTLIILLCIICLPFLPLFCICYYCCCKDNAS